MGTLHGPSRIKPACYCDSAIDAVAEGLRRRPNVEVFLYPEATHSFANPVRPTYHPAAAKLAAERIETMFKAI
jgi:dienelactone hydrolase